MPGKVSCEPLKGVCWGQRSLKGMLCFPGQSEILDTTVLLRTCVQSAVGMLRDQNEDLSRSRRRIEILLGFFSKEDELKGVCCKECPWTSRDHQNMSVRCLGIICCAADKGDLPRTCVLCVGGCRAFLLFKCGLFSGCAG